MGETEHKLVGPNLKNGIQADLLKPGQRILGHADDTAVILINDDGQIYAVGSTCTHYSANLDDGIVTNGTLRCPWHHACFDLKTGEAKKAPALSPIPVWQTETKDGFVYVRAKRDIARAEKNIFAEKHFIIVGSGAAGHAAAEMLRREGFGGRLTVLSEDSDLPYDRPNLSKDYLAGNAPDEWMFLRSKDFYIMQKIELRLNAKVVSLDISAKTFTLTNGESLHFDKCLLAMGGSPTRPLIAGIEMPHVHFLRSFSDCRSLIKALGGTTKKVVIVGAGFIGMEGASALKSRGLDVTVIAPSKIPLANVVGDEVGAFLKSVHEKNGVLFRLGQSVSRIEKDEVILSGGDRVPADVVLVATGIAPNISLASKAGINCDKGILVNEYLRTSEEDIFSAGDIAENPDFYSEHRLRVEHWVVAQRQGQTAALNMLGQVKRFASIPFFWSQQFDINMRYIGHAKAPSRTELVGDLEDRNCAVTFFDGDRVAAVLTIGRDKQNLLIEEAMQRRDYNRIESLVKA
jgi:NADPH-dependent 2,4-dienoyl-CoA reductase/sulfur reductase-like enzyme/nitrite reductase/ring-hydroxylating ferredoxin subunit